MSKTGFDYLANKLTVNIKLIINPALCNTKSLHHPQISSKFQNHVYLREKLNLGHFFNEMILFLVLYFNNPVSK